MATFLELRNRVLLLVIDTPTSIQQLTGTFINYALRSIQRRHNFKVMEALTTELVTTTGLNTVGPRPSDWKEARGKPMVYDDPLSRPWEITWISTEADLRSAYGIDPALSIGTPRGIYEDDAAGAFVVGPYPDGRSLYPDGQSRIVLPYWRYLPALVADDDTNWFTNNAEEYLVYKAVTDAFYAIEDEDRAQIWERRAIAERDEAILTDKKRRLKETDVLIPHLGARRPHIQE